jgi:hypothetical protein
MSKNSKEKLGRFFILVIVFLLVASMLAYYVVTVLSPEKF